ncbi:DUF397 domain-containing protein [Actinoplanes sp. LDG1-06]|uniref:DUF397 domain-containing protein n=1 Tax=Paractinoplanes ovalisporus TaxID=2810368 RepID=A0ABS2AFI0_9ACTN|nr:DUF397 domain-containing protein [Actinoplanes ovalisporus]MBM2618036.1 DUF397 domain-containing protein [Actinoplanes ovalisporus]
MVEVVPSEWRRSTRCTGGNCIEVAKVDGGYLIRDSKNPDSGQLSFNDAEWDAFVAGVKANDFTF